MFTFRDLNKQLTVSSLGLSLFGLLTLNVAAQAPTQTVAADAPTEVSFHLVYVGSNDPVKVTHVMLGDRDVPLDTPVPVSGMWFRKVGIVVQNVSPKTAVHGLVTLEFPETGDGTPSKPILSSALSLGRYPSNFFMQKDGTLRDSSREDKETVINVMPGESMTFGAHDGVDHTYQPVVQVGDGRESEIELKTSNGYGDGQAAASRAARGFVGGAHAVGCCAGASIL
jgi:hypothetical protein